MAGGMKPLLANGNVCKLGGIKNVDSQLICAVCQEIGNIERETIIPESKVKASV